MRVQNVNGSVPQMGKRKERMKKPRRHWHRSSFGGLTISTSTMIIKSKKPDQDREKEEKAMAWHWQPS